MEELDNFNPKREQQEQEFALECRKVRLYVAKNPASTSYEVRKGAGVKTDNALHHMLNLGLVRFSGGLGVHAEAEADRLRRWFVVPQ